MMPNLRELKAQVENANAKGVENLSKKGVVLSDNVTTLDIMNAISEINIGSGLGYQSIVYNSADDSVALIDKYGGEHKMLCNYRGGKLIGITYDGKSVDLTYLADMLDYAGETKINLVDAPIYGLEPLDYTVEFRLNNSAYKIVSVCRGLSVEKPSVDPPNQGIYRFNGWKIENEKTGELEDAYMEFPYAPASDVVAVAYFQKVREEMEKYQALSFIAADKAGDSVYKMSDGWCIAGCADTQGGHGHVMLVALNEQDCQMTPDKSYITGSVVYNGVTYYYCDATAINGINQVAEGVLKIDYNPHYIASSNAPEFAKRVLDKYFYVT